MGFAETGFCPVFARGGGDAAIQFSYKYFNNSEIYTPDEG